MKTDVMVSIHEACHIVGRSVASRPEHRQKHVSAVEILHENGNPVGLNVVLFDTETAAIEYVAAQITPKPDGGSLNG